MFSISFSAKPIMSNYFSCNSKNYEIIKIFIDRTYTNMEQEQGLIFIRYFNIMHFVKFVIFRRTNIFKVITIFWGCIVKLIYKNFQIWCRF